MKKPSSPTQIKCVAIAAVCAVLSGPIAAAATLTLTSTADSYIRASQSNEGDNNLVLIGDTTNTDDFLRGVFAFDLNNTALTADPVIINSATLTLTSDRIDSSSQDASIVIDFHELSASFTESGVTWFSRNGADNWSSPGGDFGAVLASASANPTSIGVGTEVDWSSAALASAAETAVGGSFHLIGKLNIEDDSQRNVFFFESTGASQPRLTLDYTVVPEPSVAMLGWLGLLAMLRHRR